MNFKSGIVAMAVGTFALGIAEFAMMGILEDVADELRVSIDRAGQLITAYSLGVAIGAPLLVFMRKLPLRTVLLILTAVIAAGNALAAVSPDYYTLLCSRFVAGLPHGAYFGSAAIICTRLAAQGKGPAAVALMVTGMTVANVFGVPAATFVSTMFSWRLAFAIVALTGVLAFICIRVCVPLLSPLPDTGIKGQFRFLHCSAPWLIFGGVFFGQAAVYCWLSYVSPFMTGITGFSLIDMTWIMMLVGVGMVTGNLLAGNFASRYSPSMVSASIGATMIPVLALIYFCGGMPLPMLTLSFVASACLFGIGGPAQFMIVGFSKGGEMLGGAGIQIAFNVANACSAAIGGAAIHHGLGVDSTALIGIPFAAVGMICFLLLHKNYKNKGA